MQMSFSRSSALLLSGLALLLLPAGLAAQEAGQEQEAMMGQGSPVLVVQLFQCEDPGAFDRLTREHFQDRLDAAVQSGDLMSWGVLHHRWGDEWNRVIYSSAPDIQTALGTLEGIIGEVVGGAPDAMEEVEAACSAHKDNIYTMAHVMPMPEMEAGGGS